MDAGHLAIAAAGLALLVLVALVGLGYRVGHKLGHLEAQDTSHTNELSALSQAVGGLVALVTDDTRRIELTRALAAGISLPPAPSNPFTPDESARYNEYVRRAKAGEQFTQAEVRDFNYLIERYKQDHPDDPALSGLLMLGAFLIGLYLLGRKNQQ